MMQQLALVGGFEVGVGVAGSMTCPSASAADQGPRQVIYLVPPHPALADIRVQMNRSEGGFR